MFSERSSHGIMLCVSNSVFLSYVIDGDIYGFREDIREIWRYLILIAYMVITISESCVSRISRMKSNRFVYVRHISY